MIDYKLELVKLEDVKPYAGNPRNNEKAVNAIMESIRQCTYISPVIVDENYEILAGHARYKALMALGQESAQVLVCSGLTAEQKVKFRYLDNKTGERATWDLEKLEAELDGLDLEGFSYFETITLSIPEDETEWEAEGCGELDLEDFVDEQFKYTCPKCGYRFN